MRCRDGMCGGCDECLGPGWPEPEEEDEAKHLTLYHEERGLAIYHGDSLGGLPCACDALITDPPYSVRTHSGADAVADLRAPLPYAAWTDDDVVAAVHAWAPSVRGWMVVFTDYVMARTWSDAMSSVGRYVFAPLPWYAPGSRVRLLGDGPACWTCWIVVSRPRAEPYSRWGALPGGYMTCGRQRAGIVGGKPLSLMRAIVADYSREGDVVCDPCCGAGTTLRAAIDVGRRAIGIDISEDHCRLAAGRAPIHDDGRQRPLFEEEG